MYVSLSSTVCRFEYYLVGQQLKDYILNKEIKLLQSQRHNYFYSNKIGLCVLMLEHHVLCLRASSI